MSRSVQDDVQPEARVYTALSEYRAAEKVTDAHVCEVRDALESFPDSPRLWCLLGNLIFLAFMDDQEVTTGLDPIDCYRRATEIDEAYVEAWDDMGYDLDTNEEDHTAAEQAFLAAMRHGGSPDSYAGLARIESERGRRDRAFEILEKGLTVFPASKELTSRKREIESGDWDPS